MPNYKPKEKRLNLVLDDKPFFSHISTGLSGRKKRELACCLDAQLQAFFLPELFLFPIPLCANVAGLRRIVLSQATTSLT